MDFNSALIVTIVSMVFSAFFSGMEIAFITSNRVRVGLDVQKKGLTSSLINIFYSHQDMFISTMLVGNNIMLVVYGMGMAVLLQPVLELVSDNSAFVLTMQTLISTCIILVTGEFLPKTVFRINPNGTMRYFALPVFLIYLLLYPISLLSSAISKLIIRMMGGRVDSSRPGLLTVGELDDYIQQTIDDKKHEEEPAEIDHEVKIFRNALDFSTTYLRDCMTPRNEIVGVDIDRTDSVRLRRRFTATGFSKIIVYRGDIDNVVGYIHVNEMFDREADWKTRIKPVEYAPESMLASNMMRKMLAEKKSIAVIVDEFGGTGGLVTLEDLVEEILGDFEDEHDRRTIVSEKIDDNTFEFSGRIEVETMNELYDLDLPENDEYQTLAGYILYNLEKLPQQGESFELDGYRFTVLKQSATKIELVRVERLEKNDEE